MWSLKIGLCSGRESDAYIWIAPGSANVRATLLLLVVFVLIVILLVVTFLMCLSSEVTLPLADTLMITWFLHDHGHQGLDGSLVTSWLRSI